MSKLSGTRPNTIILDDLVQEFYLSLEQSIRLNKAITDICSQPNKLMLVSEAYLKPPKGKKKAQYKTDSGKFGFIPKKRK